jgi:NAD(P)-dependent dehydrogenase (short-subunit alcohol dehydrogenase family)
MTPVTLVVGASSGIGSAVVEQLQGQQRVVYGAGRGGQPPRHLEEHWLQLDFARPGSIGTAFEEWARVLEHRDQTLQQLLICSGLLHDEQTSPERRLRDLHAEAFSKLVQVNAMAPLLLAQAALPLLPRREATRIAAISARVGSIGDNRMGGWYSYRCAKAALNMGWRCLAHELRRSHPSCTPLLYHPGTVDTELSKPFQGKVDAHKLFSTEQAAQYFLNVLEQHGDCGELAYLDWAGKPIPW